MAKRKNALTNLLSWLTLIVTVLASILVGGLFLNGTSLGVVILSWIPAIVHTVAGWTIIITAILTLVFGITDKLK